MSAGHTEDALRQSLARLFHALPGNRFGHSLHYFESIESTMTESSRLAELGAAEGTLVFADAQTAGRGRLGRQWISDAGLGLYFTLILRPTISAASAPLLTLLAGVSLATVVEPLTPAKVDLRWPNDLLLDEKKCAGILVEMRMDGHLIDHVLVGIGINVNQTDFPEGLETTPTSLLVEAGRPMHRIDLLISFVKQLEEDYNSFLTRGVKETLQRFMAISSYAQSKRVRVGDAGHFVIGTTAGLTPEGMLLLRRDDGILEQIVAGHVRPIQ